MTLLALLATLAITLMSGTVAAHAKGTVPDKPKGLVYATEGAEVSPPDMETITSLMDGLNGAHEEKVGVIITDEDTDAQKLADSALKEWGLSENGGIITITTKKPQVGVAVGSELEKNVSAEAQGDVANKVKDGIGKHADWAKGIQTGATRLFLYIEGDGLSGGTDDRHHKEGAHTHEDDDPAVEEVPSGQAPDDAYAGEESSDESTSIISPLKIAGGITLAFLAIAGLFLLYRYAKKTKADKSAESGDQPKD